MSQIFDEEAEEMTIATSIIQCILAAIACILAWLIPKKIMWEQSYSTLIADYRSYDFAIAVQGIVEFFEVDCGSNVDKIKKEYERRFQEDIRKINEKFPELCIHYQRRLLAQFFYQLDLCARSHFIKKKRICHDFTKGEANLVRLLFLMDLAIDESDILKKDISCDGRMPRRARGMNGYLADIYRVLKDSKPYMEI